MHYNMVNEAMNAKMSSTKPVVGMLATMFVGSDRYAMVVTEVFNNKKIRVSHLDPLDENAETYTDENGAEIIYGHMWTGHYTVVSDDKKSIVPTGKIYTYRKNYRWMPKGSDAWGTCSIHLGKAENYRDPDF